MDNPTKIIKYSIAELRSKLLDLEVSRLDISVYNKKYLKSYVSDFDFLMVQYQQLLEKAINRLDTPIEHSTFVDYGGGCGVLSYLAKIIGFHKVVYNDLYKVSVNDIKVIAHKLDITIDYFVEGDVTELISYMSLNEIKPNLICSFDVLEHIYNLEDWFDSIIEIENPFALVFMTAANSKNPFISRRLMKFQRKVELVGVDREEGWKEIDVSTSYLYERQKIIKEFSEDLRDDEVYNLAFATRGLRKADILNTVNHYIEKKIITYEIKHPTNTCDPYTGNWAEHLINLGQLERSLKNRGLKVTYSNSIYGYSKNNLLNLPKYILNILIKIMGKNTLFLSPTYTLEVQKTK